MFLCIGGQNLKLLGSNYKININVPKCNSIPVFPEIMKCRAKFKGLSGQVKGMVALEKQVANISNISYL